MPPGGGVIVLRKDGRISDAESAAGSSTFETAGEGTYRVEVYLVERARRSAGSLDRQQSHLRSARRVGKRHAFGRLPCEPPADDARHPGRAVARREGRRVVRGDCADGLSDRTCSVHVSSRRRRTRRPLRGVGHWRGQSAHRTHAPGLPRTRLASHARVGSGPPSAIRRPMAALDLSRRRTARRDRSVCRDDTGADRAAHSIRRSPTRCCSSSIRPTRCPGTAGSSRLENLRVEREAMKTGTSRRRGISADH